MTKCELDEDKTNRHANVEGGKLMSSQPDKNYKQADKTESWRDSLP